MKERTCEEKLEIFFREKRQSIPPGIGQWITLGALLFAYRFDEVPEKEFERLSKVHDTMFADGRSCRT